MRRCGRVLVLLSTVCALALGAVPAVASAQPAPPNPSDDALARSRDAVSQRAGEVGRLSTRLAELDSQADDLQAELAAQRETAEAALIDMQSAQDVAAAAARKAADARIETEAATSAIDQARNRPDDFVTATYQQQLDSGPLALLTEATSPEDLVARAEFNDAIARTQLAAQDALERARVDKANADSAARAALEEAQARQAEAVAAKSAADQAVAAADAAARAQAAKLAAVAAQRADVQRQLDAAAADDAGLRAQRARFQRGSASSPPSRMPTALRPRRGDRPGCAAASGHGGIPRGDRPGAVPGRRAVRVGRRNRARARAGHPGPLRLAAEPDRFRLLRADALRLQGGRDGAAPGQPQPVQRRPQGADHRPAAGGPGVLQERRRPDPPRGDVHRHRQDDRGALYRGGRAGRPAAHPRPVPQATRLL